MIPKVIYQSWHSQTLPKKIEKFHKKMYKLNPDYKHIIYTDSQIDDFVYSNFDKEITSTYMKLNHIVAKVDFWRYLVLFKNGGVYLDMDSSIDMPLSELIKDEDQAIITAEKNIDVYVQWGLMFMSNHPILEKTIEILIRNVNDAIHIHDIHKLTGPTVYSEALNIIHKQYNNEQLNWKNIKTSTDTTYYCEKGEIKFTYRVYGIDYNEYLTFKHKDSKYLYENKQHWQKDQKNKPIILTK